VGKNRSRLGQKQGNSVAENTTEGIVAHLDLDEDVGEGVGEGDVAEGLQAVPDLLRGGDVGADADAGEAALEPTISCNN